NAKGAGLRDEARFVLAQPLSLSAGGELLYEWWNIDIKFPRPPKEGDPSNPSFTFDPPAEAHARLEIPDAAAWASGNLQMGRLSITAGGRYDGYLYNRAHVFQPRSEIKVNLGKTTLRTTAGLYTRPPSWNDENIQRELKPERAWQTTLGAEREFREGLSAQATTFY